MMPPLCFHDRSGFTAGLPCFTDSSGVPMRLSRFLLPILKENPKEAEIVSHRLMLRAGMIRQEAAGIFARLPPGFRGIEKNQRRGPAGAEQAGGLEAFIPAPQRGGPSRRN